MGLNSSNISKIVIFHELAELLLQLYHKFQHYCTTLIDV